MQVPDIIFSGLSNIQVISNVAHVQVTFRARLLITRVSFFT